jgi:hypothetical protein
MDGKKLKLSYDNTWKFQIEWATQSLWVEGFVSNGLFICSIFLKLDISCGQPCVLKFKHLTN